MAPTPLAPSPRAPARAITCEAASKPPTSPPVETTLSRRGMQNDRATRRTIAAITLRTLRTLRRRSSRLLLSHNRSAPPTSDRQRNSAAVAAERRSSSLAHRARRSRALAGGPGARSEASTTGRNSTSHAGGQPQTSQVASGREMRPIGVRSVVDGSLDGRLITNGDENGVLRAREQRSFQIGCGDACDECWVLVELGHRSMSQPCPIQRAGTV